MRDNPASVRRGAAPGLVVLAICTAWLVVQNALLVTAALLWLDGSTVSAVAGALVKAAVHVVSTFWSSPIVLAVLAGATLAMALRLVSGGPRQEARHV